jgi:aryl-alcohol dehydrogenase-like predicted oxidoreductase
MQNQVEANRAKLEQWEKLCAEIGAPPADVALAWLLHQPVVTAPIIGPRTVQQVDDALGALDVRLTDDVLAELDRIFPGPGGAAPEAYSW